MEASGTNTNRSTNSSSNIILVTMSSSSSFFSTVKFLVVLMVAVRTVASTYIARYGNCLLIITVTKGRAVDPDPHGSAFF